MDVCVSYLRRPIGARVPPLEPNEPARRTRKGQKEKREEIRGDKSRRKGRYNASLSHGLKASHDIMLQCMRMCSAVTATVLIIDYDDDNDDEQRTV